MTESPILTGFLLGLALLLSLYLLRSQMHALIAQIAHTLYRLLRLSARACLHAEQRVRLRNHEVSKVLAEELMQRRLEREFMRIENMVEKDLANYQHLAAQINSQLNEIGEDYERSALVPLAAPDWISAVQAIAALPEQDKNSDVLAKILADIHETVQQHQREVLREYRWTVASRHKLLANLRPNWRRLGKLLAAVESRMQALSQRLAQVDRYMGQYESMTQGISQDLMSSIFMRFLFALVLVCMAGGAAYLNFELLLPSLQGVWQPQAELLLPEVVGALHTAMIVVAAVMIFESLRITHLFPLVAAVTVQGRKLMLIFGCTLLFGLAGFEAVIISGLLTPGEISPTLDASKGLLFLLGLVTPMMVAMLVIPLEYLLYTSRSVLGRMLQLFLQAAVFLLRFCGQLSLQLGRVVEQCFDIVIFIPLLVEQYWQRRQAEASPVPESKVDDLHYPAENVTKLPVVGESRK